MVAAQGKRHVRMQFYHWRQQRDEIRPDACHTREKIIKNRTALTCILLHVTYCFNYCIILNAYKRVVLSRNEYIRFNNNYLQFTAIKLCCAKNRCICSCLKCITSTNLVACAAR
mgnify:FL=1